MNKKLIKKLTLVFFSVLLLLGLATQKADASQQIRELKKYDTTKDDPITPQYELEYPNKDIVKVDSLEKAQKLLTEWKLLYTDITNDDGLIIIIKKRNLNQN